MAADKDSGQQLRSSLTSRCLEASSLRDINISLVRMLRKCMSLSRVARFTVAPFVDWREHFERGFHQNDRAWGDFSACRTDQHDELVGLAVIRDAVRSDGLPQVLVNVVI